MVLFGERGGTRTLDPMIKSPVMRLLAMGGEGRQGLGPNFGPKLQNTRRNGVVRSDLARRRWPNKDGYNVTTRYRGTRTPSSFKTGAITWSLLRGLSTVACLTSRGRIGGREVKWRASAGRSPLPTSFLAQYVSRPQVQDLRFSLEFRGAELQRSERTSSEQSATILLPNCLARIGMGSAIAVPRIKKAQLARTSWYGT
jgi:hypothetical protein